VDKIDQHHLDRLSKAFDDLARREGLDSEHAFFADETDFIDDKDIDFTFNGDDDDDDDGGGGADDSGGDAPDASDLSFSNVEQAREVDEDSMEARIASAARERDAGMVAVPWDLDELATSRALDRLGFQREVNPFGNDETPRKERFATLLRNPLTCPACGSKFQCDDEARPGFLPRDKYETQVSLSKFEQEQALQLKAESDDLEWSPEDEVEWLLKQEQQQQERKNTGSGETVDSSRLPTTKFDLEATTQGLDLDLVELSQQKPAICKRCHGLQNFGKIDDALRPGWTSEPTLSQEKFRNLLKPLRDKPAVIIALVDLFDFSGSVLAELDGIAGKNPVILAANKVDLLPDKMGTTRVESWVRRELDYLGVKSLANIGGAVRLVSCKTGQGIAAMMGKARALAEELDCDIYVIGAANAGTLREGSHPRLPSCKRRAYHRCLVVYAGKSTLLNHILAPSRNEDRKVAGKRRAGNANKKKGEITTSPLPGTTLEFIKVDLGDGRTLYDTPGLLVPGTLTQILTPDELKVVIPRRCVTVNGSRGAI
jgi:ribosome biogenesis GTPase A